MKRLSYSLLLLVGLALVLGASRSAASAGACPAAQSALDPAGQQPYPGRTAPDPRQDRGRGLRYRRRGRGVS